MHVTIIIFYYTNSSDFFSISHTSKVFYHWVHITESHWFLIFAFFSAIYADKYDDLLAACIITILHTILCGNFIFVFIFNDGREWFQWCTIARSFFYDFFLKLHKGTNIVEVFLRSCLLCLKLSEMWIVADKLDSAWCSCWKNHIVSALHDQANEFVGDLSSDWKCFLVRKSVFMRILCSIKSSTVLIILYQISLSLLRFEGVVVVFVLLLFSLSYEALVASPTLFSSCINDGAESWFKASIACIKTASFIVSVDVNVSVAARVVRL